MFFDDLKIQLVPHSKSSKPDLQLKNGKLSVLVSVHHFVTESCLVLVYVCHIVTDSCLYLSMFIPKFNRAVCTCLCSSLKVTES